MDQFKKSIDQQIISNKGKNLFLSEHTLRFKKETIDSILQIDILDKKAEESLINYASEKAIEEFCRVNQYYSFSSSARDHLKEIYSELISTIRSKKYSTAEIESIHYKKIKEWISLFNPFAEKLYSNNENTITPITCAQYSAKFQINFLGIDLNNIKEPLLDIGCGKDAKLVKYLTKMGIRCYGFDRYKFLDNHLKTSDWLEFRYEENKWGTIISNLGFSNHFIHHNLRDDGNYLEYAKTYMKILSSLQVNGTFYYAPDLPFIEKYLDHRHYLLYKKEIEGYNFKVSAVKRLK